MNKRLIIDGGKRRVVDKPNLKQILKQKEIVRLCGVHNTLIASLAEKAGFEGVWLSSFEAHASCRLPDADILTVSDYSDMCNKITDRIVVPMLVDGDAGGGSVIITMRMVREYEKNGAAGICIEDNKYPKRCSFYKNVKREIEDPKIHASKIRACIDNRIDDNFLIVARTEALIVGMSVGEAIDRANIYTDAGAEAILIHYKGDNPKMIFEFSNKYKGGLPLVSVPTTYNIVTEEELIDNGFKIVIYANYGIRSIVKTLQRIFSTIIEKRTLSSVNSDVVDMSEIFKIVGVEDLGVNEKKYMQ